MKVVRWEDVFYVKILNMLGLSCVYVYAFIKIIKKQLALL